MVRCFVGIFVQAELKKYILSLQDELRKLDLDCKFVEEENIHISVSFIGDIEEEKADVLKQALGSLSDKLQKFPASTGQIRLVPSEKFVRVIVIDILGEAIKNLQSDIVDKVGGDAKPPHITLCRTRGPLKPSHVEMIKNVQTKEIQFTVNSVDLISSVVTRYGPTYTTILRCNLA
ncbi:RNA 2',3'-cyclic phosphodiesterase [archaeon]|nr:MAG: RNA 2',3'-cyclic phosphodiesterase [archaeon]